MTLGSLFDGIGGWLIAAERNGVKPLWRSEIDEFPRSVSEYHFPNVKSYGDIRKLNGAELEPVDIICAGSPCQNLSQSGNRRGLKGAESSLFYEAIRIVREMREATNGKYPRFFVWENVKGAFTSNKGNDFRAVLEEITETRIPFPRCGRWANAGLVRSKLCEVAWRVLDAQYWGVPQRRERIFLVADFIAKNRRAEEILFVPASLPGNPAKSKGAREGIAEGARKCSFGTDKRTALKTYRDTYTLCANCSARMNSPNPNTGCVCKAKTSRTLDKNGGNPSCNQGGTMIVEYPHDKLSFNDRVCGAVMTRDYKGVQNTGSLMNGGNLGIEDRVK